MVTARAGEIVLDSKRYKLQDPKRWQKQPVLRAARKMAGGDSAYSDYDLWNVKAWNTWHLGKGEEYFETDGRFYDSWNAETRIRGQITLGPHMYATGLGDNMLNYESGALVFGPCHVGVRTVLGTDYPFYAWAESFTTPSGGFTADMIELFLRKEGSPPNITAAIYTDDGGSPNAPNTLVAGATKAVAHTAVSSEEFGWIEFDWTGTVALDGSTIYWLVISIASLPAAGNCYNIYNDDGAGYSGDCSSSDADPWDWTDRASVLDLWFRIEGIEGQLDDRPVRFAFFNDNGTEKLFVAAGTKVYAWDAGNDKWDDDTSGITGTITDMVVWDDHLVVAQGTTAALVRKTGGAWGAFSGDSEEGTKLGIGICPTGDDAGKVVLIKSGPDSGTDAHKVRCIAAEGDDWQDLKSVDGADTLVGDSSADITWIGQYMGSIWFGKEDGVYEVGKDGIAYCKFPFFTQKASWNFEGSCVWHRNELMLPAAFGLWSFDGKTLKNIGPGIGLAWPHGAAGKSGEHVGLPQDRQGVIKDTLPTVNALYVAIDGGTTTRYSSVMLWTGRGWHEVVRGDSTGTPIRALGYTPAATVETYARLWYGYGRYVFYAILPDITDDPYQWANSKFENQGWVKFGWFNAGLFEVDKDWREVTVEAENVDAVSTLEVHYKLDDDSFYTSLGVIDDGTVGTAISNNQATLSFGTDTYGKRIRLKVYMATDDPDNTPKVTNVRLKYWKTPDPVYGWNFTLKLTDTENIDRSWRTQQSDFKTTYEEKEPVTLVDPYGASHTVRLDNLAETIVASDTGEPLGCLITVRAVEA